MALRATQDDENQVEGGQFCPQPAFSRLWPPKRRLRPEIGRPPECLRRVTRRAVKLDSCWNRARFEAAGQFVFGVVASEAGIRAIELNTAIRDCRTPVRIESAARPGRRSIARLLRRRIGLPSSRGAQWQRGPGCGHLDSEKPRAQSCPRWPAVAPPAFLLRAASQPGVPPRLRASHTARWPADSAHALADEAGRCQTFSQQRLRRRCSAYAFRGLHSWRHDPARQSPS